MQLSKTLRYSLALAQFPARSQGFHIMAQRPNRASLSTISRSYSSSTSFAVYSTAPSSSSASSFVPPEPPSFKGQAMFPDLDIDTVTSDAAQRNQDADAVFVVTGASRGIGLQIVKELLNRTKGTVIACCRSPKSADGINSLINSLPQNEAKRVSVQPLDLEDQISIDALAASIKTTYNRVDVLFNVAGILGDGKSTAGPERSIRGMDREWTMKSFNVNYIGPMFLSQACAPMMRKKRDGGKSIIANLSARVGSISDNGLGGWISYRSSKAALNQATRTAAFELKRHGTYAITLHPGTTNTDLSKPFQGNVREDRLFPVEFTAGRMIDAIDACSDKHTGGFYDWSGKALPF